MTVKRKDGAAVRQGMLDDDYPLITPPAIGLGIHDQAMADAVNGRAEILTAGRSAPIFAGMIFIISLAEDAKIAAGP